MEICPICLDAIDENSDTFLKMPICKHSVHTHCALSAAQYDIRCPICRTSDPQIKTKEDDNIGVFQNLELIANEHTRLVNNYKKKKRKIIKKDSKLTKIDEKIKAEKKLCIEKTKELDRKWTNCQKELWKNEPIINDLKKERKKKLQKVYYLEKKMANILIDQIGPPPDEIAFIQQIISPRL